MPSLKDFHLIFVFISVGLCMYLAYLSYSQSEMIYLGLSIISMVILIFYGSMFYRKLKELKL